MEEFANIFLIWFHIAI